MDIRSKYLSLLMLAASAVVVATVTVIAIVGHYRYQRDLEGHLKYMLGNIAAEVETRLAFGLSLRSLRDIQGWLERTKALDPNIVSVEIHDRGLITRFSTDRGTVGTPIPADWSATMERGESVWSLDGEDTLIVGVPILSPFGRRTGGVVMAFSTVETDATLENSLFRLTAASLILLVTFWVLAAFVAVVLFRGPRRRMERARLSLAALGRDAVAVDDPIDARGTPNVARFRAAAVTALGELHAHGEELKTIDESL